MADGGISSEPGEQRAKLSSKPILNSHQAPPLSMANCMAMARRSTRRKAMRKVPRAAALRRNWRKKASFGA
jgi:hypothetical protein